MRLKIFHETFAVPVLSLLSVFILPLAYLYVVTSPALMVGTASYLKNSVYKTIEYAGEDRGVQGMLKQVRQACTSKISSPQQRNADTWVARCWCRPRKQCRNWWPRGLPPIPWACRP